MEDFLKLYKEILYKYNIVIGGSISLILQNVIPERKIKDIDIIIFKEYDDFSTGETISKLLYRLNNHIKFKSKFNDYNNPSYYCTFESIDKNICKFNIDVFIKPYKDIKIIPFKLEDENESYIIYLIDALSVIKEKLNIMYDTTDNITYNKHVKDIMSTNNKYFIKLLEELPIKSKLVNTSVIPKQPPSLNDEGIIQQISVDENNYNEINNLINSDIDWSRSDLIHYIENPDMRYVTTASSYYYGIEPI